MKISRKISEDIFYLGGNDRRIALFENAFSVPEGISYNSYLIKDEKTVLMDTVDKSISSVFMENLSEALGGEGLDYLVISHMEPDHCGTISEVLGKYKDVKLVGNAKTLTMLKQFFELDTDFENRFVTVNEGDVLSCGKHELTFIMAPMVHWPEVMMTFDKTDEILFSADAFGTFGAVSGSLFASDHDFETKWLGEARRYYTNIVGKYGAQVNSVLKKTATLDINMLCPLHGPIWKENISWFVEKYLKWASYEPEDKAVLIAYGSVYGNTEEAAETLAAMLYENGVKDISVFDVSKTHPSYIVSEAFRCSDIVFASVTYNGELFGAMETLVHDLKAHNLQNRRAAVIENGSWAAMSGKHIVEVLSQMKNITLVGEKLSVKSAVKRTDTQALRTLAGQIAGTEK